MNFFNLILTPLLAASLETVPRLTISDSTISIANSTNGIRIQAGIPYPVYSFEDSLESCGDLVPLLESAFSENGAINKGLRGLDPEWRKHIQVNIVLDDFGAGRSLFKSYFKISRGRQAYVWIDCDPETRFYLRYTLVHELTHALLEGKGLESWFVESIAQWVEASAGGRRPRNVSVAALEKAAAIPPLFQESVINGHASYGITYLFSSYVYSWFGGWSTLRAMSDIDSASVKDHRCDKFLPFIELIQCRALRSLESREEGHQAAAQLRSEGLFGSFAHALVANRADRDFENIPGWSGFKTRISTHPAENPDLPPGQILLLESALDRDSLSPGLRIIPFTRARHKVTIVINETRESLPLYRHL